MTRRSAWLTGIIGFFVALDPASAAERPFLLESGAASHLLPGFVVASENEVVLARQPSCQGFGTNEGAVRIRRNFLDGVPPTRDIFYSDPTRPSGFCNQTALRSNLAWDGTHIWFVDGVGFLSRLPRDAPLGTPVDPEFVTAVEAGTPAAQVVWTPNGVFVLQPGSVSSIVRFEAGGSPLGEVIATGGASAGDLQFDGTDLYWREGTTLRRWTPGSDSAITVATGVTAYFAEGTRFGSCSGGFCFFTRNVYTGDSSGQVFLRTNGGTGAPSLVHQSAAPTATVVSLVTDATRLFVLERRPNDDPTSPFPRFALQRTSRSALTAPVLLYATDFLLDDPATAMDSLQIAGSYLVWRSIESVGAASFQRLRRLPTDAEAITERDLEVTSLEVTQAVQDIDNSLPLVAGRRTFVRVHVRAQGADVTNVSAVLRGRRGSTSLGTLYPLNAPGYRLRVPAAPRRVVKDESFLFELPWSWVEARSDLVLDAEVNPNRLPPEPGYDNNVRTLGPLSFATSPRFRLLVNLMRYRHKGIEYVPSAADLKESLDLFRGMFPLASFEAPIDTTYRGFLVSRQVVTDDGLGSRVDQTSSECSDNLCATYYLNARRNVYRYYGQVPGDDVYVFNMINDRIPDPRKPGSFLFARGGAPLGGRVGTGSVRQDFVGVHEMLHNLGRPHPLRSSGDPKTPAESPDTYRCGHDAGDDQFPYADTLLDDRPVEPQVDFLGFDILTRRVLPPTTTDVIGYCNPGAQWISDYTWNATRTQMFATESSRVTRNAGGMAGDWLVFSGIATPSRATGRLLEVQRASSIVEIWTDDAGPYRLRQRGADGSLLAERAFGGVPEPDSALPQDGFTGAVLLEPGTRSIELVDTRAGAGVLDSREVLPLPPILTAVAVANPPDRLAGPLTLTWDGVSPLQAPLRFDVFVVTPAGDPFPIVEGLSTSSAEIDGDALPGPEVRFRVVAHDGVNTAVAESPLYSVRKRPPTARILVPDASPTLHYGQLLNLSGAGEDPDGENTALEWTTADRILGSAPQVSVEDLEPGDHLITLTVTDGDAETASASLPVRVLYEPEVPTDPQLAVGPDALGFHVPTPVGTAAAGVIEVGNAGPGELIFQASSSAPWIQVEPSQTVAPASVVVTALANGFGAGETRTADVLIREVGGGGQSRVVPVTLSVGTTPVPEPSGAWLGLASGIALWTARRGRRRTRPR